MKVGRRLAMKVLNASKFVLGNVGATDARRRGGHRAARPRPCSAGCARGRARRPTAFDAYDYTTGARGRREVLLDVLRRLPRAGQGARVRRDRRRRAPPRRGRRWPSRCTCSCGCSRRSCPFVTEEVWSWWQDGSIHRASWPDRRRARLGRRTATPLAARRRRGRADRHPRRQVAGEGLDARRALRAWSSPARRPWSDAARQAAGRPARRRHHRRRPGLRRRRVRHRAAGDRAPSSRPPRTETADPLPRRQRCVRGIRASGPRAADVSPCRSRGRCCRDRRCRCCRGRRRRSGLPGLLGRPGRPPALPHAAPWQRPARHPVGP